MADAPAPAAGGAAPKIPGSEKVVNPTTVLILGFVTCGLYMLYWMWLRVKEMNEYLGKQVVNPMFVFPGCICGPVMIYAMWLYVNGLPEMQKKAGDLKKLLDQSAKDLAQDGAAIADRGKAIKGLM